ncbi:CZB domain-containing protein [Sulfurisoma sediminicola]|uniref:Chemoreceptor zinc-binding protein n=1 Tax=Sulfurisoma sediminicola TaxID=1381557 RepID=A0A497XK30_9PROT|nr:CZB domain-containing protein [Sulfurisoma sediminicola]RLJ68303.1 chemoreceptor zinc-binding protein [Sulfurisoma sediminicola]
MGLMDWFRNLAGGAEGAAADMAPSPPADRHAGEAGGLNFMTAIDAHMKWKTRLENYINGTSDEDLKVEVVSCDDKCPLGQWLHGPGGESYGAIQTFDDMKAMHAHFHTCAGHVLTTAQQGRKDDALRMLDHGDYVRASERLKMQLAKLYVYISER